MRGRGARWCVWILVLNEVLSTEHHIFFLTSDSWTCYVPPPLPDRHLSTSRRRPCRRLAAGAWSAGDPVGQGCFAGEGPRRVSPPADGAEGVDEPQWPVGLHDCPCPGRPAEGVWGKDPGAVSSGVVSFRGHEARRAERESLVSPQSGNSQAQGCW